METWAEQADRPGSAAARQLASEPEAEARTGYRQRGGNVGSVPGAASRRGQLVTVAIVSIARVTLDTTTDHGSKERVPFGDVYLDISIS